MGLQLIGMVPVCDSAICKTGPGCRRPSHARTGRAVLPVERLIETSLLINSAHNALTTRDTPRLISSAHDALPVTHSSTVPLSRS